MNASAKIISMKNNVQFVTSPLLSQTGVAHGWFTCYGGVSTGLFESLNGKKGNGDADANVNENRQRAMEALAPESADQPPLDQLAHIIHEFKNNILEVEHGGEFQGYDASISKNHDQTISQTTADCASVIIASVDGLVVALVHGSWHTLSARIICNTVTKIKTHTSEDLVAGIGPMICKNCYEFGAEAADLFETRYLTEIGEKYLVDLKQMVQDQLKESGVTQIDDLAICTKEDERFFSHRRDGAHSGRFLTLAKITDVI